MKYIYLTFALLAATAVAQDQPAVANAPKVESKALDKETFYHLESIDAKIEALAERYRIGEYRKLLEPIIEEKNKIVVAQCAAVGVPEKEIEARCRVGTKEKDAPTGLIQWVAPKVEPVKPGPRVDSKSEK